MYLRILGFLICFPFLGQAAGQVDKQAQAKAAAKLRARIEATPALPFDGVRFSVQAPSISWKPGLVSWLAVDGNGTIYELRRGEEGDPVLALDREGKLLRSKPFSCRVILTTTHC
jgi:hypothetical protein